MIPRFVLTSALSGDPAAAAERLAKAGAEKIYVIDEDADLAGAPQNVEALHRILNTVSIPVLFEGGISLVHTAELVLGLGADSVVVGIGLTKTELSARHFFAKLGDRIIGRIDAREKPYATAARLQSEGCKAALLHSVTDFALAGRIASELSLEVYVEPFRAIRNLKEAEFVALQVIIPWEDFLART